jgi:hypothetical protein
MAVLTATSSFVQGLERWIEAVKAEDFVEASERAKHCRLDGDLLIIHPDFIKCFSEHTDGADPKQALSHFCQFLECATLNRARVLGKPLQRQRSA